VSELWDIGRSQPRDKHEETEVEEEKERFRSRFEENHGKEIPQHPYKIYRDIVGSKELSEEERAALYYLKDEYADKWEEAKRDEVKNQ
jgi:hypothetical protein